VSEASRFGLIVLAAGLSRRMGGPNKLLQPYRGEPLLSHALRAAGHVDLDDSVVVSGRDAEAIEELARSFGMRCVHNFRYAEGLGTSLVLGAAEMLGRIDGVFVALGDMPDVLATDYLALSEKFAADGIVLPLHEEARGHPVLFSSKYLPELRALSGDEGARSILNRHPAAIIEVNTPNPGVLRDLDRPGDFLR
jgi:molybdenum cofactor cytidylyltransferase